MKANQMDSNDIFGTVFCVIWVGSIAVTINAKLLGGSVGFFHSVCTLGYSLLPMNIVALFNILLRRYLYFWLIFATTSIALLWSVQSASLYMSPLMPAETKWLALYPIFLFYVFLALFIIHMTVF